MAFFSLRILDFTVNSDAASYAKNRFSVVFAKQVVLPVTFTSIQAQQQQNNIVVRWNTATETNIKNYQVQTSSNGNSYTGISTETAIANTGGSAAYTHVDSTVSAGLHYYRIRSTSFSGNENYSAVVKVNVVKAGGEIAVYPNPVTDGLISIQLKNMPAGRYQLHLMNALGQVKMNEAFDHTGGNAVKKIDLTKDAAKGIYTLEIVKPDNSKTVIGFINQ